MPAVSKAALVASLWPPSHTFSTSGLNVHVQDFLFGSRTVLLFAEFELFLLFSVKTSERREQLVTSPQT